MPMNILVCGGGYVGASLAAVLSEDNNVIVFDTNIEKVKSINNGISPISDPLMKKYLGHFTATNSMKDISSPIYLSFVCVPTDFNEKLASFDLSNVTACLSMLEENNIKNVVIRSTLSFNSCQELANKYPNLNIVYAPEFLKEGEAIFDITNPSRIVIGYDLNSFDLAKKVSFLLNDIALNKPNTYLCSFMEAEAAKLFANSYLAMRVAFFNELDSFCKEKNISTSTIISSLSDDPRIGKGYNEPSFGYGGYCLPKDSKQLLSSFSGVPQTLIKAIVDSNAVRKKYLADKINNELSKLKDPVVGIYGISSKKGGANHKSSPMEDIINYIKEKGHKVVIYDPKVKEDFVYGCEVIKSLARFGSMISYLVLNDFSSSSIKLNVPTFKVNSR